MIEQPNLDEYRRRNCGNSKQRERRRQQLRRRSRDKEKEIQEGEKSIP